MQLADLIRARTESGELPPGTRLASEARLAQEYGIGSEATRMAVSLLHSEDPSAPSEATEPRTRRPG
ncbi:hypothetical protein ACIBF5_07495 [Micromonospora sp. NPDC050417]|uniref:hypothetical protein n=1 Tax=Micromonospora sp. NPDC050417 TaxID=3364280 RepID=UPI00378F97B9